LIYQREESYLSAAEEQATLGNTALAAELVTVGRMFGAVAPDRLADVYGYSRTGEYAINFSDPANSTQVADVVAKGYEIELVGRLSENWNIGINGARQQVSQTNAALKFIDLFEELTPAWQQLFDLPGSGGEYAAWKLNGETFIPFKDSWDSLSGLIEQVKRTDGVTKDEIREWRWNAFTNYTFADDSKLAGFGLGGALRYQSDVNVGYHSDTFTNDLGETAYTADLNRPITGPASLQGDMWFSYKHPTKLWDKFDWSLRLNIRNAMRDDALVPVKAQPDTPYDIPYAQMRVTQPTTYILSSTFRF